MRYFAVLKQVLISIGTIVIISGLLIWVLGPPGTNKSRCRSALIAHAGLHACFTDVQCMLNDGETFDMYLAGKESVIACARSNSESMYNIMDEHLKEAQEKKAASEEESVLEEDTHDLKPATPKDDPDSELQTNTLDIGL